MDVATELRAARERRGFSLQHLSDLTRISLRNLEAIEANDERRLPPPVFTRGFVRSYAREVGLEPDTTAARYLEQFVPEPPPPAPAETGSVPADAGTAAPERSTTDAVAAIVLGTTVLVLVGILGISIVRRGTRPTAREATAAPAAVTAAATAPAPPSAPIGTTGSEAARARASNDAPLEVVIAPSGPCWVKATIDGQVTFAALLNAGDRRTVTAAKGLTLRVGDPATFKYTIDGRPGAAVGKPAEPVTLHIDRGNYQDFVPRARNQ